MNTKRKLKKGGPKGGGPMEAQMITTIEIVKQYWPDYPITLDDIRNPTTSFVLKFYKDCIDDLEAKITFATRTRSLPNPPSMSEEEILYLKLSRIPALAAANFKLGDLYVFEPKRLSQHMFIAMHVLISSESVMDKMIETFNEAFDVEQKRKNLEEKLNKIREEKMQAQIALTLTNSEIKKEKELVAARMPKYEETLNLIQLSEAECKDSILEAERLRNFTKNLQEEIQKLEKTEATLKSKIVSEAEFNSLEAIRQSLEKEDEELQVNEETMDLLEQKKHAEQLQTCVERAKHFQLDKNVFELHKLREELQNLSKDIKYTQAIQKNSKTEIAEMKKDLESQVQILEKDIEITGKVHVKHMDEKTTELVELKKQRAKAIKEEAIQITELKNAESKIEAEHEMIKDVLSEQHLKICTMHKGHVEDFIRFLNKAA